MLSIIIFIKITFQVGITMQNLFYKLLLTAFDIGFFSVMIKVNCLIRSNDTNIISIFTASIKINEI